jgi:hypothetical protein
LWRTGRGKVSCEVQRVFGAPVQAQARRGSEMEYLDDGLIVEEDKGRYEG